MGTAADELTPETEETLEPVVVQPRKKIDYGAQIDLDRIAENFREQMGRAKQIISILSLTPEELEVEEHDYIAFYPMRLPGRYILSSPACQIEFKPGWGTCKMTTSIIKFDMKLPESPEEFRGQLAAIENFSRDYLRAESIQRTAMLNAFKREMNPPTVSADSL